MERVFMNVNTRTCWMVFVLTLLTSVTPTQELVAGGLIGNGEQLVRSPIKQAINDVELKSGGILSGQVVDSAGQPLVGQAIVVRQSDRAPINSHTDEKGRFRLHGLSAGLCSIEYGEAPIVCRCWSPNTAPPAATNEVLLITGESIERSQRCVGDLLTGPGLDRLDHRRGP